MFKALREFDTRKPNRVQEVHIVYIEAKTNNIMRQEFAWWFGVTPTWIDESKSDSEQEKESTSVC